MYAITSNAVLTYWIVWLLAFPLNALAMHALAWRVTRDHAASFLAGIIYAFCFFRMHHAHGHLQLLWTWALPLVPITLERWLVRPTWRRALLVAALVIVQALSSWYLAVFVALLVAMCVAVMAGHLRRAHVIQALAMLIGAAVILGWFARPYFGISPGPIAEAAANSADLKAYLMPPENTWIGQWLLRHTSVTPRWIWGEQTLYVGSTPLLLTIIGALALSRNADRGSSKESTAAVLVGVVLTGLLALALSFGPSPVGWSPFDLFSKLPGMGLLRAPARFALLAMMAMALVAAWGFHRMLSMRAPRTLTWLALLVFVVDVLLESFVVKFPSGKPAPMPPPAVYERLAAMPRGAVLSLPTYRATPEAFREADYLLFSTVHWFPIVNGFGRLEPPEHAARMEVFARFPDADAVELMRRLDVRYVVLHTKRASELMQRVEAARALASSQLIYAANGDFLFKMNH